MISLAMDCPFSKVEAEATQPVRQRSRECHLSTTLSVASNGSCTGITCTAAAVASHPVTGEDGAIAGTTADAASLQALGPCRDY